MSSEDRDADAPQADESAPMAKVTAEDSSSSDESDSGRYTISQTTFDALTARGFSDNAIKKSVVAGCINEATCAKWIQMHEGHPELDTALEDGVNVVIKAKRVLTEAEREVKLRELQERVRRTKEEEKLELQRKERERLEMGRNMIRMKKELEDVRRKMNMEEVRRENAANVEARRRIRVQIAADRLERRGHTKAEALALAEKEFEEATTAARAEAAARLAKLQEQQASAQTTTPTSGGTWNLSTLTAASSMPNKLAEWFAGDAPTCPQALVDKIRKREAADKTGECVRTLRLILGNIVTEPFDTKKRTLRVSTKAFRDTILPVEEAVQLLRWCGFALSTDAASSPSLCLSTVVMRRLYQVLALLDHEGHSTSPTQRADRVTAQRRVPVNTHLAEAAPVVFWAEVGLHTPIRAALTTPYVHMPFPTEPHPRQLWRMPKHPAAVAYDDVTRKRKDDRSSQQVAFRHFNNFVKKRLIQFSLDSALASAAASPAEGAAVLDLASGRGGDLGKWLFMQSPAQNDPRAPSDTLHTSFYDCYDVSVECINEAERRWKEMVAAMERPPRCCASFTVADCFTESFLRHTLPTSPHFGRYSVVTIQFAFHYACKSLHLVREVFSAVSRALAPGGVVLITTVDITMLSKRVAEGMMGNELYRIAFPDPPEYAVASDGSTVLVTGTGYHFHLEGFVDCLEYVVPYDAVVQIASESQLRLCELMSKPFSEFVPDYSANWKANKGNKLSQAELELVTLYRTLCFQKQSLVV